MYLSNVQTKKNKILVSKALQNEYRQLVKTASKGKGLEIVEIGLTDGKTDLEQLEKEIEENTASVIVQYSNFLGQIEPLDEINKLIKAQPKALMSVTSNPISLVY